MLRINPEIDRLIDHFYFETVNEFWPPERTHIENRYNDIAFPLLEIASPKFEMKLEWNLYDLCGYLNTWSAVKKFIAKNKTNPVDDLQRDLEPVWGEPDRVKMTIWPIFFKAGKFADAR